MNNKIINLLILVALYFVAVPRASAQDRFYADDFNMEPVSISTVSFCLDNSQERCGHGHPPQDDASRQCPDDSVLLCQR